MANTEIEKREEKTSHLMDSLSKVLFGFIPGGHAAEVFLNYRQDLKSKRTLHFIESFSKALSEIHTDKTFSIEDFTTEDFVDVFDSVILKVQMTKSVTKLDRFKKLLLGHAIHSNADQKIFKYIDLIDKLSDEQIVILKELKDRIIYKGDIINLIQSKNHPDSDYNNVIIEIDYIFFKTTRSEIDFYVNDLVASGLIILELKESNPMSADFYMKAEKSKLKFDKIYKVSSVGLELINLILEK